MNIKLLILSIWFPKFLQIKELEKTSKLTNEGLDRLLKKYSITCTTKLHYHGSLDERRAQMAEEHNKKIKSLVDAIGYEQALKMGRAQMFEVGYEMGNEARERLGVGEKIKDTLVAARILYKVLGINFTMEKHGKNLIFKAHSCALAHRYSPVTCKIMSAADKGVLKGLNSKLDMEFINRITEGAEECTACINIESGEKK